MSDVVVCALYRFVRLPDFQSLREPLLQLLLERQVKGTLLLAPEGINGTVAGSREGVDALLAWLVRDGRFAGLNVKESRVDAVPFDRAKVKLKREIVTLGVPGLDPLKSAGTYVKPRDWNRLVSDPEVLVIDTRNEYEVRLGKFRRAIDPGTATFREFPEFVRSHLDPSRHRRVAMYCTGGIRCEKSTALLREMGFDEVYHLEGGILQYLEEVAPEESLWEGECFVFDERVSVDHHLAPGSHELCRGCRMPVSEAERAGPDYVPGVSCPHCAPRASVRQRQRFEARQRQIELARARGEAHIGSATREVIQRRRLAKRDRSGAPDA